MSLCLGWSELMLWILLACVPLMDVVSMAVVPRTLWRPRPQRPIEVNEDWWSIKPRVNHRTYSDLPQFFQPWQPQLPSKYPQPPVEPDSEDPHEQTRRPWKFPEPPVEPDSEGPVEQAQRPWKFPEPPVEPDSEVPDEQARRLWNYPEPPVEPDSEVTDVQLVAPVMIPHLAMKCGINTVKIEVQKDLWGNGNLIKEADLTLGRCSYTEFDPSANVISFEYKLELCCSEKSMTDDFITYTYVLEHQPKMSARIPITRTQNTKIELKCHYPRQVASKQALQRSTDEEPVMP